MLKTLKKSARIASLDPSPKNATLGSRLPLTREYAATLAKGAHIQLQGDIRGPEVKAEKVLIF